MKKCRILVGVRSRELLQRQLLSECAHILTRCSPVMCAWMIHMDSRSGSYFPNATTSKFEYYIVTSRVCRHRVTWHHRWRHQSTRRRHFPIGSMVPYNCHHLHRPKHNTKAKKPELCCVVNNIVRSVVSWATTQHNTRYTIVMGRYQFLLKSVRYHKFLGDPSWPVARRLLVRPVNVA